MGVRFVFLRGGFYTFSKFPISRVTICKTDAHNFLDGTPFRLQWWHSRYSGGGPAVVRRVTTCSKYGEIIEDLDVTKCTPYHNWRQLLPKRPRGISTTFYVKVPNADPDAMPCRGYSKGYYDDLWSRSLSELGESMLKERVTSFVRYFGRKT